MGIQLRRRYLPTPIDQELGRYSEVMDEDTSCQQASHAVDGKVAWLTVIGEQGVYLGQKSKGQVGGTDGKRESEYGQKRCFDG